jgi:colanic acid biosynthesis protein WcaH
MLSRDDFATLVRIGPLVSIDLVIRDPQGRVLVGLRQNEPARDWWFVPGGSIRKNERLDDAFRRIADRELGLDLRRPDARLLGVYEHLYETNFTGEAGFGTHYVVLGYAVQLDHAPTSPADDQHAALRWLAVDELLADPQVHANTKAYFTGP